MGSKGQKINKFPRELMTSPLYALWRGLKRRGAPYRPLDIAANALGARKRGVPLVIVGAGIEALLTARRQDLGVAETRKEFRKILGIANRNYKDRENKYRDKLKRKARRYVSTARRVLDIPDNASLKVGQNREGS